MQLDSQVRILIPVELAKLGRPDLARAVRALPPLSNLHRRRFRETLSTIEVALEDAHPDSGCLSLVRDCLTELHLFR